MKGKYLTIHVVGADDTLTRHSKASFDDFLRRFEVDGQPKYLEKAKELVKPERNTLQVSYQDVEKHNSNLASTIIIEYYR